MTEAEWRACDDPAPMLELLNGRASDRSLRQLVCACYRRCGGYSQRPGGGLIGVSEAVDLVEQIEIENDPDFVERTRTAHTTFTQRASLSSHTEGGNIAGVGHCLLRPSCSTRDAVWALVCCCRVAGFLAAKRSLDPAHLAAEAAEPPHQAALVREIFGNPARPVRFSPSWRTDTALLLANQMYESRDFSAMPILADAIQDAGCDSAGVLTHCREPAPHVRGCWVVDLVRDKR
jgi:hypothetical protein